MPDDSSESPDDPEASQPSTEPSASEATDLLGIRAEILENPEAFAGKVQGIALASIEASRGPLPPPEWIKAYDAVVPGAGAQLFESVKSQQEHRQRLESNVVEADIEAQRLGQWSAIGATVLSSLLAGYALYLDQTVAAVSIVGVTLVGGVGVFIAGKRSQGQQLDQRRARSWRQTRGADEDKET